MLTGICVKILGEDTAPEPADLIKCERLFGKEERERLERIKNPARRRESLGGLLALATLAENSGYEFPLAVVRDSRGRPRFLGDGMPDFSISHSGRVALCALSDLACVRVGIDVEKVSDANGVCKHNPGIENRFFGERELAQARRHGDGSGFFSVWTAKEALLKMRGDGVSALFSDAELGDTFLARERSEAFFRRFALNIKQEKYFISVCFSAPTENIGVICDSEDIVIYEVQD